MVPGPERPRNGLRASGRDEPKPAPEYGVCQSPRAWRPLPPLPSVSGLCRSDQSPGPVLSLAAPFAEASQGKGAAVRSRSNWDETISAFATVSGTGGRARTPASLPA